MVKCLIILLMLAPAMAGAQERPNIVLFFVDDMGWQDTSVPFWKEETPLNRRYRTPNMVRLAQEGMKFTNAYSTPVCTPTRTSLMTGMNAAHHHVTNWTHILKDHPSDATDSLYGVAPWKHNGLSPVPGVPHTVHATPLPQLLKDAGYFTVHAGKAHWAPMGTPGANPYNMGFIVNIAGNYAGHPQSFLGTDNYGNMPGRTSFHAVQDLAQYYGTDTYLTEALTREALRSIATPVSNGQPFFLNMSHYAVHVPLQQDRRFYQHYLDAGLDSAEAKYASMIEGMDKSLGDIMDFLRERKVDDRTIIIFMSDNGGFSLAPPRGGNPFTHNLPLRAGKGSVYEGGIREPMIVKWPGVTRAGSVAEQYVIVEDFFPTILEMANIREPETVQEVDGRSFVPLLKDPALADASRVLIWHYPNKWIYRDGPGINYKSALRQGDWKLVYHIRSGQRELFNLKDDIGETRDLAAKNPAKVKALTTLLSTQLQAWKTPMPVVKSTGKTVPYPDAR